MPRRQDQSRCCPITVLFNSIIRRSHTKDATDRLVVSHQSNITLDQSAHQPTRSCRRHHVREINSQTRVERVIIPCMGPLEEQDNSIHVATNQPLQSRFLQRDERLTPRVSKARGERTLSASDRPRPRCAAGRTIRSTAPCRGLSIGPSTGHHRNRNKGSDQ